MPAQEVHARTDLAIVGGWFDPLTADVARWLEGVASSHRNSELLAVVFDGPQSLLPAESRAILIAALRTVDLVTVLPHEQWADFLSGQNKLDAPHSTAFIDLVLRKNALNSHA